MKQLYFIDFDDTLCIHKHKINTEHFVTMPPEMIADKAYIDSILNKSLYQWLVANQYNWIISNQDKGDAKVFLLTTASSFMLEAKKIWVEKYCPKLNVTDYISTSADVSKADVIAAYNKIATPDTEIIFVDDNSTERSKVENIADNITVFSPQYISELIMRS